jgi:anionic cell wall polymer biosynthesis LytR-Cps2A-Psr (LCP) family protein
VIFGGVGIAVFIILAAFIAYLFLGYSLTGSTGIKVKDSQKINIEDLEQMEKARQDSLIYHFIDSISAMNEKMSLRLHGDRVSIIITGLDGRLGTRSGHADANHLLNIWLDSAVIEVISIPRGTLVDMDIEPLFLCDTTEDGITVDTVHQNYLANCRYLRGRNRYIKEVENITNTYGIDYFVEFGFSQAMGILELLGYKDNSEQMLRILRSRKSYSIGDYQRTYNQGQFIRQMILKHFNKMTGLEGDVFLFAGLMLVESNISHKQASKIVEKLQAKGFPKSEDDVIVRIMPRVKYRFNEYDFADNFEMDSLFNAIYTKYDEPNLNMRHAQGSKEENEYLIKKLNKMIAKAVSDSAKYPVRVISSLKTPYDQRIWFQVKDSNYRSYIRKQICTLLIKAYKRTGKLSESENIESRLEQEEKVIDRMKNN